MAVQRSTGAVDRAGGSTSIADVIDRILDKGLVIDAWVRVSIVGIEILTVEARVVVASVETYLKYADAIAKLQLASTPQQAREVEAKEDRPRQIEQPEQHQLPSPDDIQHYLDDHGEEGLSLDQLAEHFHAPPAEMAERLRSLEAAGTVRSGQHREGHS